MGLLWQTRVVGRQNTTTSQPSAENDSDTNGPTAKAPKMSLQLHKQKKKVLSPSSRFNKTVSTEEIHKSSKGCIPQNTACATSWAVRVFKQWVEQHNKRMDISNPIDLL